MRNAFYLKNRANKDGAGKTLAARFLSYGGKYIQDPNLAEARNAVIFSDAEGKSLTCEANPDAYFIVPANYSIENAIDFSNFVSDVLACNGLSSAYGLMVGAFMPNGSQDLQRTYPESDGQNPGCFVSEFTDSASFHFGFVSEYSGIGEHAALVGGGSLNVLHWERDSAMNMFRSLVKAEPNRLPDISGANGNNPHNVKSIHAGAMFAHELHHRYGVHSPQFCYGAPTY